MKSKGANDIAAFGVVGFWFWGAFLLLFVWVFLILLK